MLHTDDDFLTAITAQPTDRTLRLVYADWLDERADPRAELVRVEEEMRELPVFGDRFWELKPRRNELRALAGAEWCGRMRYGTECEPVFRHGIPDGWRERWRLIREFTERWHRVPMGDIGDRQADIVRMESHFGRTFPPAVREWIAFGLEWLWARHTTNTPSDLSRMHVQELPGNAALSVWYEDIDEPSCDSHLAVLFSDLHDPDPPLRYFRREAGESRVYGFVQDEREPHAEWATVTASALSRVLNSVDDAEDGFFVKVESTSDLCRDLVNAFPKHTKWGRIRWFEAETITLRLGPPQLDYGRGDRLSVSGPQPIAVDQIPGFVWSHARNGRQGSGVFKRFTLK